MGLHEFSVGVLHGWRGVLLGLSGAAVFMVSGWQDVGPGVGMTSSALWFVLALASTGGVILLGFESRIWWEALLGVMVFASEVWLIGRWWRRPQPPDTSL